MNRRPQLCPPWTLALILLSAVVVARAQAPAQPADAKPAEKIKVTKLDDLPKHTYKVAGPLVEFIRDQEKVAALARTLQADIDADLAKYDVTDASTLQGFHQKLANFALVKGDLDGALQHVRKVRELESKEAKKLTTGLFLEALAVARHDAGADAALDKLRPVFTKALTRLVDPLPWKTVEDEIQQSKGQLEIFNENLLTGMIQSQMQPVLDKTGELNADMAASLVGMHVMLTLRMPLKDEIIAVYQAKIDANKVAKADIWGARVAKLSADQKLTPVLLGVWDSGTDITIFKDQLWTNDQEKDDGKDHDGNGYAADVHGIAYDINAERTTGLLCPLGDAAGRIGEVMKFMKGFTDIQSNIDSPEAQQLKKHLATLDPKNVQGFIEDLGLAGNYSHGTHVAGLMVADNPFARLLVARLSYDHRTTPVARTVEWGQRDAAKCRDTVAYFKQHGVRVVNMSWGEAQKDAEDSLEKNGLGKDADDRRQLARQVFKLQRDGLFEAIKNAPDVLFICAAGNSDNDVNFDEDIPSSFDLPNLLVVGAVDQAGEPTSFTSFGKTVRVYANGFEVESYVPGGQRMNFSGTSMASPNVVNLAGKLLAINPRLKPAEVIDLILKNADEHKSGERKLLLINPQKTVETARSAATRKPS
jgi:subtilisin family serine protease